MIIQKLWKQLQKYKAELEDIWLENENNKIN